MNVGFQEMRRTGFGKLPVSGARKMSATMVTFAIGS